MQNMLPHPSMQQMQPQEPQDAQMAYQQLDPRLNPQLEQIDEELEEEELDFHANILDVLDDKDVEKIRKYIWPMLKRGIEINEPVKENFANTMKLLGAALPIASQSSSNINSVSQSYLKNSGSEQLMSGGMLDCYTNIRETIIHLLFGAEGRLGCKIAPHLQGNPEAEMRAKRQEKFSTAYFSRGIHPDFKSMLSQAVGYAIVSGDCFRKTFDDPKRGWPRSANLLPGDYFYLSEMENSSDPVAFVHVYQVNREEMKEKVDSGAWSKSLSMGEDHYSDREILRNVVLKHAGRDEAMSEEDASGIYTAYDIYCELDIESDRAISEDSTFRYFNYRITMGSEGQMVGIYRHWEQQDPLCFPINDFTRYSFVGGLSEYSLGLMHMTGQRTRAATVLQRGLLDSSQLANVATGFIRPTGNFTKKKYDLSSGEFADLPPSDDDVNKAISYMPYNQPSPLSMQLLQKLEGEVRQFSHMVSDQMMSLATQAPATSVLAVLNRLEQMPNAILQSMYDSFCAEMRVCKRKIYNWLPAGQMFTFEWQGEVIEIEKDDFSPGLDIVPCGSFSMESQAYRSVRAQLMLEQGEKMPQFHNLPAMLKSFYKDIGLTDEQINSFVVDPNAPKPPPPAADPANENAHMMTGQPVQAYIWQDHDAHMTVHQLLFNNPDPQIQASGHAHIKEHEAMKMLVQLQQASGVQLQGDLSKLPPEQQNQIAVALAQAAEQLKQQQQAQQPPAPIDPSLVKLEEIQANREKTHMQNEIEEKKIELEREKSETQAKTDLLEMELQMQKYQHETLLKQMEMQMQSEREEFQALMKAKEIEAKQAEILLKHVRDEIETIHKQENLRLKAHESERLYISKELERRDKAEERKEKQEEKKTSD